jgi:hypothetical protein
MCMSVVVCFDLVSKKLLLHSYGYLLNNYLCMMAE